LSSNRLDAELSLFDPLGPSTMHCPVAVEYASMRAECPVFYVAALDLFLVTRYDLVCEVVRDPVTFSSATIRFNMPKSREEYKKVAAVIADGYPRIPTLLSADPPAHTRYRRFVSKAFSPKAIAGLEPLIRSIATRLIDEWVGARRIDFVAEFALPLPMEVIAAALSVPDERLDDAKRWSEQSNVAFGATPSLEVRVEGQRGVNELQRFFADAIEQRRREPQDDLLTSLLNVRIEDEGGDTVEARELDLPEMLSIVHSLLVGGNETTTKMLAEMMRRLADDADLWDRVRGDPSLIPLMVEEALRLGSPAAGSWRIATRDVELGGVVIPKGSQVIPLFGSANHDEQVFEDAETFDPYRPELHEHVAFGRGVHTCPGAALTRLEGRVALEELSARLGSLALSETNDFSYSPSYLLRGLTRLDLDIETGRSGAVEPVGIDPT
jgi:cytochrome P450